MKKFLILNGTELKIIERNDIGEAKEFAVNFLDHSKEIIVREVTEITDYSKEYINQP